MPNLKKKKDLKYLHVFTIKTIRNLVQVASGILLSVFVNVYEMNLIKRRHMVDCKSILFSCFQPMVIKWWNFKSL